MNGKATLRKLGRFRKNKYFSRLIVTTILLAVLPNLITSMIAYYNVTHTFEKEKSEANLQYLNQTMNGMEIIISQIKDISRQIVLNQTFSNFESFPNGAYYENIKGEIKQEDLAANYWYRTNKQEALQTFQFFRLTNDFVDTVYFYDYSKGLVFVTERDGLVKTFPFEAFYDKSWIDMIQPKSAMSLEIVPREAQMLGGGQRKVLTAIINTAVPNNALIININENTIYNRVAKKLNVNDGLYIVSNTGTLIMTPQEQGNHTEQVKKLLEMTNTADTESNVDITMLDKRKVLVAHSYSSLLDWRFISVADLNEIYQSVTAVKQIIIFSAILFIALTIALSYINSRVLYKPIHAITALIKGKVTNDPDPHQAQDDLHFIGNMVQETLIERELLQRKLDESLPYYRERFMYALLVGTTLSEQELEEKQNFLHIPIESKDLFVLVLSLDEYEENSEDLEIKSHQLYKLEVMERLETLDVFPGKFVAVEMAEDKVAIVLNAGLDHIEQVFQSALQLMDRLRTTMKGAFSIGMGRYCSNVKELTRAYEEAQEALQYRFVYGWGQVIYIEDVVIGATKRYRYPKEKEEIFLAFMKTGELNEAKKAFHTWVDDIHQNRNSLSYSQIQAIYIQLLTGMVNTLQSMGSDLESVFNGNPYEELFQQKSMHVITVWFDQVIERAMQHLNSELQSKQNQHVSKIIEMLQSDLSADLTLYIVSHRLSLNPAYVGRLFKQLTGKSFAEYVTELRLHKSKKLLTSTELTINDISAQVGYQNAYYYIRVFKEATGMTPGEYRKKFSE